MSDLPHKCGVVLDFCYFEDKEYRILFCIYCHQIVGYEKDGVRYLRNMGQPKYNKKQYSEETLNDSV